MAAKTNNLDDLNAKTPVLKYKMIHKQQRRPIKKYKGKAKTLWIDASALFNASYSQTGTQPVSGCTAASFLYPPSKIPFVFQEIKVILHFFISSHTWKSPAELYREL